MIKGIQRLRWLPVAVGLTFIRAPPVLFLPFFVALASSVCELHAQNGSMTAVVPGSASTWTLSRGSQDCFWELPHTRKKGALSQHPAISHSLQFFGVSWVRSPHPWTNVCAKRDVITGQLRPIRAHSQSWGQTPRLHGEMEGEEESSKSRLQLSSTSHFRDGDLSFSL